MAGITEHVNHVLYVIRVKHLTLNPNPKRLRGRWRPVSPPARLLRLRRVGQPVFLHAKKFPPRRVFFVKGFGPGQSHVFIFALQQRRVGDFQSNLTSRELARGFFPAFVVPHAHHGSDCVARRRRFDDCFPQVIRGDPVHRRHGIQRAHENHPGVLQRRVHLLHRRQRLPRPRGRAAKHQIRVTPPRLTHALAKRRGRVPAPRRQRPVVVFQALVLGAAV
mmetsp:Transcript_6897/g.26076  ORF Transcript_6897/g.26076 Transcript_6897/m.26076 type:complete len:220 (+) Transcript_6897:1105-1764(+)